MSPRGSGSNSGRCGTSREAFKVGSSGVCETAPKCSWLLKQS